MADVRLGTLNKVLLIGRLTQDPEMRYTPSGAAVLNMRLAVNRRYQDQGGEWRDDTCFVNAVAWQKTAERLAQILKKGSAVLVEGRLQSRSWETQDGQKRTTIEVNAMSVQNLDRRDASSAQEGGTPAGSGGGGFPGDSDDDIPF